MVDNVNPTSQFHPYVPQDATPQTGKVSSGMSGSLGEILSKFNAGSAGQQLKNVRGMAQNNGGLVLGGLAALAIGAGLMRKRSMTRG
jgi:hypothetical protein